MSANEGENEIETREKRKRNLMNLKFEHKNPDLARSRSTIIIEECLGKYDAVMFDSKTKDQWMLEKLKRRSSRRRMTTSNREIISTLTPSRKTLKLKISWENQRA